MVRATDKICGKLDHEITFEMLTFKIEVKKKGDENLPTKII